ncbi:MAG: alpha/beta hydrolase [Rhodospirillaceae bacterium]|nr:alpha/beta hydrolase [Rhodospirillaceae bacterium]|tara:strand:+ start:4196 stop:5026 length:831 start_codon:yes stop_codon:yes gene_type:complete
MAVAVADLSVTGARGRFAVRTWTPPSADGATPLLLFHDSLGCIELWRDFPEALAVATRRTVIAYDRLGFGRSDPHPGQLDLDFIAAEARLSVPLLQQACGFETFVACGHSVGGGMAVEAAARHADRCRALITLGAQAFVEDLTVRGIRDARGGFETETGLAKLARYHGDKAEWALRAWVDTWLSPAFKDWSLADALGRVTCPVLAIHGAQDPYGSRRHADLIAGRGGTVEVLEDAGHFPHREAQQTVVKLISTALSRWPCHVGIVTLTAHLTIMIS